MTSIDRNGISTRILYRDGGDVEDPRKARERRKFARYPPAGKDVMRR
jgi:hypothetical protein